LGGVCFLSWDRSPGGPRGIVVDASACRIVVVVAGAGGIVGFGANRIVVLDSTG
jgi:hypothetical protein